MKRKRKNFGGIDFGIRSSSGIGVFSSCLVAAECLLFLAAVYYSYLKQGQAGMKIGAIGFLVFVLSVVGTVSGGYGLSREGYHHGADLFGLIGNGIILIGICVLFVIGTMQGI
ncbi:MAG: hypothetical protein IJ468_05990 [Lachnospiraceae bacterium]|nr:hypothetical protein [Lachnospiraceae bacterium]